MLWFIFLPILSAVVGEFLLKYSVDGLSLSFNIEGIQLLMSNPLLFVGVFMIIISAVLWVIGMSKFQLSFMYPFLSVNYVIIVVGSEWILNEQVDISRYIAIMCIVIGLIFISKSPYSNIKESNNESTKNT